MPLSSAQVVGVFVNSNANFDAPASLSSVNSSQNASYWSSDRIKDLAVDGTLFALSMAGAAAFSGPLALGAATVFSLSVFSSMDSALKLMLDFSISDADRLKIDANWGFVGLSGRAFGAVSSILGYSSEDAQRFAFRAQSASDMLLGGYQFLSSQSAPDWIASGIGGAQWMEKEVGWSLSSAAAMQRDVPSLNEMGLRLPGWRDGMKDYNLNWNSFDPSLSSEFRSIDSSDPSWDWGNWTDDFQDDYFDYNDVDQGDWDNPTKYA